MPNSRALPPATVAGVLASLQDEPGRPRITWYGTDGERVELSGAVLANWVAKTTNLLVDELDAAPGTRVRLDLPPHWRTAVWALAVWRCGACVVLDARHPADVVVTTRPGEATGAAAVVGLALGPLARAFGPGLPPDAVDGTAVLTYPDTLGWVPDTEPDEPALVVAGRVVPHGRLVPGGAPARATRSRVAIAADSPATVLLECLATWATDGSVVLVDAPTAAALRTDPERRARVLGSEQVTVDRLDEAQDGETTPPAPRTPST